MFAMIFTSGTDQAEVLYQRYPENGDPSSDRHAIVCTQNFGTKSF